MKVDQLRISGFSGLDTESMVEKLMEAQRTPLYKLKFQKQLLEWKREDYRSVNSLLLELKNAADKIRMQSSFQKKSGTSSNESILKVASVTNTAMDGVHKFEVNKLASAAAITSDEIADIDFKLGEDQTITINEIAIDLKKDMSIKDIVNEINKVKGETGVQVNFDESNKRLFFMNTKTGSESKIDIEFENTPDGDALKNALSLTTLSAVGEQAEIIYNGTILKFDSNSISVNGLSIELKDAQPGTTVNVTIGRDTKSAFESIVKFIDKYNEVIEKINSKLGEEKKKGIEPISDKDREALSEKQLELWEKNARSGIIRNDSTIQSALGQLRLDFSTTVKTDSDEELSMFSFGFSTGDYTTKGKIIIDTDKLQEALSKDPDKVMDLFSNYSSSSNAGDKYKGSGIAERIYQNVNKAITRLTEKAGSLTSTTGTDLLSDEIKTLDRKISDFENKLVDIEDRYWKQFTAMEKALSTANSQASWLASFSS